MNDQLILAVDKNGRFTGHYVSRTAAHAGDGIRHLALTLFLFNRRGELLLQRRRHRVFDNIWDNTASTHQHHTDEGRDETDAEAAARCLRREWGIGPVALTDHGGFNYFARCGELCENEHCRVMTGQHDGPIRMDPEIAYEYRWLEKPAFRRELEQQPEQYSPWCRAAARLLAEQGVL